MKTTTNTPHVSEIKLSYHPAILNSMREKIISSKDSEKALRPFFEEIISHHESFCILCLNRNNKVIGKFKLSEGGTSGTVVDTRIIAQAAILSHSSAIILCHNHPSGNTQPSSDDIDHKRVFTRESGDKITAGIKTAMNLFEIAVLDHIILTDEGYYSFADEGIM